MTKPCIATGFAAAAVLVLVAVVLGGCSDSQRVLAEAVAVSSPPPPLPVAEKSRDRLEGYFDPEEVATMSNDQKAICLEAVREMEGSQDKKEEVKEKSKK